MFVFFLVLTFPFSKVFSILIFHSALAFQRYQIYYILDIYKVTVVQKISAMNKKSYFDLGQALNNFDTARGIFESTTVFKVGTKFQCLPFFLFDLNFESTINDRLSIQR